MKSKKGQGLSLSTIVIAAIVLLVLIVIIAIFRTQITGIAKGFTGISEDAQTKAEESKGGLSDIFGTSCEDGEQKCSLNVLKVCQDGKWNDKENCGDKTCNKDTGCV